MTKLPFPALCSATIRTAVVNAVSSYKTVVMRVRQRARRRRAMIFRKSFQLTNGVRVLDLGGYDGSHIASVLAGSTVPPSEVYIADINCDALRRGQEKFGFNPVVLQDDKITLPFSDKYFDIVFCSSVIEHVTAPKCDIWNLRNGKQFRQIATQQQTAFASEIRRIGKQFFVQTPYKYFPIESHVWLPFVGWLPHSLLVPLLRIINRVWVKKSSPDWHLLGQRDMKRLFPDATIVKERFCGLTKSIIAVQSNQ